jgi:hypothetical protein
MRHNPTAQFGLKIADQQKYAVIKTAFDPFLVAFHELAGLAFVTGKLEQHNEHLIFLSL